MGEVVGEVVGALIRALMRAVVRAVVRAWRGVAWRGVAWRGVAWRGRGKEKGGECTWMTGVAKVESHTCTMPLRLASSETAVRSVRTSVGLAGDSEKISVVLGLMCACARRVGLPGVRRGRRSCLGW